MNVGSRLAVAAVVGMLTGVGCTKTPGPKSPATDSAAASGGDRNGCGNHPPGACAAASSDGPTAPTGDAPTCLFLARKCHPYDAASPTAHACHELGHTSTNDAECQAKKAECVAACGGQPLLGSG